MDYPQRTSLSILSERSHMHAREAALVVAPLSPNTLDVATIMKGWKLCAFLCTGNIYGASNSIFAMLISDHYRKKYSIKGTLSLH